MVTIEVGAEEEQFVVHQSFLRAKSPYFEKALSGSFQEATTRFVRLPELSPILFRIFVAWLYHGNTSYLPPPGRTVDEDFASLEITEESLQQNSIPQHKTQDDLSNEGSDSDDSNSDDSDVHAGKPPAGPVVVTRSENDTASTLVESPASSDSEYVDHLEDDPISWPFHILIQLYVLADYFQIHELKTDSLDTLIHAAEKQSLTIPLVYVRYIYNNTSAGSPLRKYVVHKTAYRYQFDADVSSYAILPAEFLAAIMVASSRRLPYKQCKGCYGDALEDTQVLGPEVDERNVEEDIPPYETDLCFYHEHPNDQDREACRLRREDPKPGT
jgi:hypothetical protein